MTHLGQDDELFAREIQLFDSLSKDDLRSAVRVHLESYALDMQNADKQWTAFTFAVSKVVMPWSYLP